MPIIKEVYGNLLDMFDAGDFDAIAHGCNCFNVMGAGIAAQIARRYPGAYEADMRTIRGDRDKLGKYSILSHTNTNKNRVQFIFNMYTQYTFWDEKDMLSYDAVESCFRELNDNSPFGLYVGIPKIGAGLAMGDWDRISEIINRTTPKLNVTLVHFRPK